MTRPPVFRCAVYTRKSTEEGLDEEYNSLHAQRDACEAYIRSQAGEGWTCLKMAYDDGGISGGTMERPGLKQLLADIAARRVDVVVVYKVDRLTRSLRDFSRIVDVFDKNGVSFVSVTQSFNTTSSMGRLTLNMLLSFAQFEREVTSERIRDKIAASKKKGMWMGGGVPLGYEATGRTLKINDAEAETVRHIFSRYLALRSAHRLVDELKADGVKSKRSVFSTGRARGGADLDRGALYKMLANPAYLGKVRHKDEVYDGLHPAIVDQATFDAVQALLTENSVKRTVGSARRVESALVGMLFDAAGRPMTPTFSYGRAGRRYRYYVSSELQKGPSEAEGTAIRRVPGPALDRLVADLTARLAKPEEALLTLVSIKDAGLELSFARPPAMDRGEWPHVLGRVNARLRSGENAWSAKSGALIVMTPVSVVFRGGRTWIDGHHGRTAHRPDPAMVTALRRGHGIAARIGLPMMGPSPRSLQSFGNTYERCLIELAFLAPDIQRAILEGQQPKSLTLSVLQSTGIPADWPRQRLMFGFSAM